MDHQGFKTIILGIDPGTKITGYGVVSKQGTLIQALDYGCIRPPQKHALSKRYRIIFEAIVNLLEAFKPDALAIEAQFVGKNPASTIKLGMANVMGILAASLREIPIFEYAPSRAKQAITGNGRASKVQMQKMLKARLCLQKEPEPEDAADALGLAMCHALACQRNHHEKFRI